MADRDKFAVDNTDSLLSLLKQLQDQNAFLSSQLEKSNSEKEASTAHIKTLTQQIETLTEQLDRMNKQSDERQQEITALINKIVALTEQVAYFQKQLFGSKSEKSPKQRAEAADDAEIGTDSAAETKEPAPRKKSVRPKGKKADQVKDLPVTEITVQLEGADLDCPNCGGGMNVLGKKVVREVVEFRPAELYRIVYVSESRCCGCTEETDGYKTIVSPAVPTSPIQGSLAGPGFLARIFHMKFVLALPIYRQEKEWSAHGLGLNRNTLSNWLIVSARDWLAPIYEMLHEKLVSHGVLHADETVYQILRRSDGKKATSDARIWIARTTKGAENPVVYYHAALTRAKTEAEILLKHFSGYLHCDGYSVYRNLPGIEVCACLAHIRRRFKDITSAGGVGEAVTGEAFCDQIFRIERETMEQLEPGERKRRRLEVVKPVLEAFYQWLEGLAPMKGKLQEAVKYALKLKGEMFCFLEDGRLQVSNNICEQLVRPVAIGRKNYLFSASEDGAKTNAMAYTIIETAKANGLNPEKYLKYLFEKLPNTEFKANPELLEGFLPWSARVQGTCI